VAIIIPKAKTRNAFSLFGHTRQEEYIDTVKYIIVLFGVGS